jgi:hypothetical protein
MKSPNNKNSKGVLILRTISCYDQKTDTTAKLYCTLSTYVTPKTLSHQNPKNYHKSTTVLYSKYISM